MYNAVLLDMSLSRSGWCFFMSRLCLCAVVLCQLHFSCHKLPAMLGKLNIERSDVCSQAELWLIKQRTLAGPCTYADSREKLLGSDGGF